jgi:hypothetical protein
MSNGRNGLGIVRLWMNAAVFAALAAMPAGAQTDAPVAPAEGVPAPESAPDARVDSAASPDSPAVPASTQGEITHNDVYVRSGPSMNHYPICKLRAGDRVTIVAKLGEWLKILPPPGTFSLISGDYVDSFDNQSGTVNGDNVRVRAGSLLNDQKYTVQTMVSKGAGVKILGRNPDGFLKIEPPPSAAVWVHGSYVSYVPEGLLLLEAEADRPVVTGVGAADPSGASVYQKTAVDRGGKPGPALTGDPDGMVPGSRRGKASLASAPAAAGGTDPREGEDALNPLSPLASVPETAQRNVLEDLDDQARAELRKPAAERDLESIINGYRPIAEQTEDELAKSYAEARIKQLTAMAEIVETLRKIRELGESTESKRREFMEERANADFVSLPVAHTGFDAQGQLRVSALYPPGSLPRRYRLIDPSTESGQTIGYVELPEGSPIEIDQFLGEYVGVRASEKRVQVGGVDPVPVFVARELVLLQPPDRGNGSGTQGG